MNNPQVSNPNDFKVVEFTNKCDFTFTPEMGCMYDSRPIFGITGAPGINAGQTLTLPYHIGHRLAVNLAKIALTKEAPSVDPAGIPTGVPLWDTVKLETLKNSYLTEKYVEARPIAMSETDKLMERVEQLNKMVETLIPKKEEVQEVNTATTVTVAEVNASKVYQDKAEVIAELEKRGIQHDKRQNKANLEKLLA